MAKQFLFQAEARHALQRGLFKLTEAVRVTLGPRGRHVVIDRKWGTPAITNDGVTIAREIELADPFENMGAMLGREVSAKTQEVAGDGTTTAVILTLALVDGGLRALAGGVPAMALRRGMERASAEVVREIARLARPVRSREEMARVAALAANEDEALGELIAVALERVGRDGVVTVEEGKSLATTLEVVEGMQFDQGYASPYFITDPERMEAVHENPALLFLDRKLNTLQEILPLLEEASRVRRPLVVVAEDVENEVLATLVVNRLRGTVDTACLKAPGYGETRRAMLEDLAVLTGGVLVAEDTGRRVDSLRLDDLGGATRIVIGRERTTVIGGKGQRADIEARMERLRRQIEDVAASYDREKLVERLARLAGGVGVITVGAPSALEMAETKSRAEDAIAATRAAVEEGVVPGGGSTLLRAAQRLDPQAASDGERAGVAVLRSALEVPLAQIAANAGLSGDVMVARVREAAPSLGFNAVTLQIEDLERAGILDPAKVVRAALQNAVSIAGLILTTETLVAEIQEPPEAEPSP